MKVSYIFLFLFMQLAIFASENALHETPEKQVIHSEKLKIYTVLKKKLVYKASKKNSCNMCQSAEAYKKMYIHMLETQELEKDLDTLLEGEHDVCRDQTIMTDRYDFDYIFNPELVQKDNSTQRPA